MNRSRWLRLYAETCRDPKIYRLSDRIFRFWINCLCLASEHDGLLPIGTDISFHLRMPEEKVLENLAELKMKGLLDEVDAKRLMPHNWKSRQYESDSSTDRVKRFRKRSSNVSGNGEETFHETDQNRAEQNRPNTETDQTQKQTRTDADFCNDWNPDVHIDEPEPPHQQAASSRPTPRPTAKDIHLPEGLSPVQVSRKLNMLSTPEFEVFMEGYFGPDWRTKLMREENGKNWQAA